MSKQCCDTDQQDPKKNAKADTPDTEHNHEKADDHDHEGEEKAGWKSHWDLQLALLILIVLLMLEYAFKIELPQMASLAINGVAYLLAGRNVLELAFRKSKRGDVFNEFVLMSVAISSGIPTSVGFDQVHAIEQHAHTPTPLTTTLAEFLQHLVVRIVARSNPLHRWLKRATGP